jgi:hypothetical protein
MIKIKSKIKKRKQQNYDQIILPLFLTICFFRFFFNT